MAEFNRFPGHRLEVRGARKLECYHLNLSIEKHPPVPTEEKKKISSKA